MRLLTVLLICAILLTGCWTGDVRVGGVYYRVQMNGAATYYVDLIGNEDIQVTLLVYQKVLEYADDLGRVTRTFNDHTFRPSIICDFEFMPGSKVYDDVIYCDYG